MSLIELGWVTVGYRKAKNEEKVSNLNGFKFRWWMSLLMGNGIWIESLEEKLPRTNHIERIIQLK